MRADTALERGRALPIYVAAMSVEPLRARVLVIDDHEGLAPLLRTRLAPAGAEVHLRRGLDDGLAALRAIAFDVVLLDVALPGEGDLDAVHRVVGAAPGADVVVVGDPLGRSVEDAVRRAGVLEVLPRTGDVVSAAEGVVRSALQRRNALGGPEPRRGGGDWRRQAAAFVLTALTVVLLATAPLHPLPAVAVGLLFGAVAVLLVRLQRRAARSEEVSQIAVEQVQASQRRHRLLATLAPVGIIETDASGACTYVNPRWCELTGLAPREAWGDGWMSALHPDDRDWVFTTWVRAVAAGRELQLDHRVVRPSGESAWVSVSSVPVFGAEGEVVGHLTTLTDVGALKAAEQASEETRSQLAGMIEHWPGAAYLQDRDGTFLLMNTELATTLGTTPEELVGRDASFAMPEEYLVGMRRRDARVLEGEVVHFESVVPDADGTDRVFLSTKFPIRDADDEVAGMAALAVDITERKAVDLALRDAEERFRQAFDDAPIGMVLADLDGRFLQVNQALCDLTGYPAELLTDISWHTLVHPDDVEEDVAAIAALLQGRLATHHREERLLHAAGEPVWVSLHLTLVKGADGSPRHLLAQLQDVTERKRFEGRLQHMADHDPLTGLLNRRRFEEELDRQVAAVQRYGARGALLVLDLDHFKVVNDTLGHNAGDELIVSVADVLRARLRETDVVARLGGDEFAILLPEADLPDAELVAASLVGEIRRHATVLNGDRPRRVTASLGVALFEPPLHAGEEVLVNADLAMYDAKEAGRDRHAVFATERYAEPRMKSRVAWVERIHAALEDDRFVLEAQPIRDLHTGEITQCELLLRMLDGEGGTVPPGAFLYVAERYDLIQDIDRWVASRAIELLHEHPGLIFEVNVSGKSLNDPLLLETIETGLQISGVDPRRLIFEVTETAAVANIHQARIFAERLAALGCRFALDDFGAGFGSFYYLKHLPFDYLKIDGEFISNCLRSRTDQLVIEAVVGIARGLGKATIAEFVGDDRTERFLRGNGVDFAQGFHIGRPVPLEQLRV